MICPKCEKRMNCIDSRNYGAETYRRYVCSGCEKRVTSEEKIIPCDLGLRAVMKLRKNIADKRKARLKKIRSALMDVEIEIIENFNDTVVAE